MLSTSVKDFSPNGATSAVIIKVSIKTAVMAADIIHDQLRPKYFLILYLKVIITNNPYDFTALQQEDI